MNYDYLIVGAGIIGLTLAYELKNRNSNLNIIIVEKENDVAKHASGRNSGVLHAGFYYSENSLKAKFTVKGNLKMKEFCKNNNINVNPTEKIVIAKDESELEGLHELYKRAKLNGVKAEIISERKVEEIDPNISTYKEALYSPSTASVNPVEVCFKLKELLIKKGVHFKFNSKFEDCNFEYRYLINCAGLYADKIAKQFGCAKKYTILPFKGMYLKYLGKDNILKKNVYPIPNLKNPFLGIHFTLTADNRIKIGPTAAPAFWRENYRGFSNFNIFEFFHIIFYQAKLFIFNSFNFRELAINEMKNYFKSNIYYEAKGLVKKLDNNFGKIPAGIRAQLLNKETNELVDDFVIEHTENSTHVLNAVSPGFTCSFSFSEYVLDQIKNNRKEVL